MENYQIELNIDKNKIYKKLKLASDIFDMAYAIKKYRIKAKYPDKYEDELHKMTMDLIYKGCR